MSKRKSKTQAREKRWRLREKAVKIDAAEQQFLKDSNTGH
jgi:hypothetical protein